MLLSCQTNSNIIYSWFQERYAHIRYRLSNIKKEKNTVYFRCKISTAKTETISSRYFNPLRKSNFWQASQDFDPLFFQRFGAPSSSVLVVHAHDVKFLRDTRCSRSSFPLLPLGSIPAQSLPVREIYRDFHKSEKPQKFLPRSS